jgi:hypothetical protein
MGNIVHQFSTQMLQLLTMMGVSFLDGLDGSKCNSKLQNDYLIFKPNYFISFLITASFSYELS